MLHVHPASPLLLIAVAVLGPRLVVADVVASRNSSVAIAIALGFLFLLIMCCGIQRRRRALASGIPTNPYTAPPVQLTSYSRYPHGMQYGSSSPPTHPHIAPAGSEYPPPGAADSAPPPYVKEDSGQRQQQQFAPPSGPPPPTIDAPYVYSPPPGPPPRAHISSNSADFSNGFSDNVGGFRSTSPPMSPPPRSPAAP
ncbi:hypothetical protein R3P38DRAFT_2882258 [Favolaschia claudopus]|uniref:Uncharacterized protein n=1 Tax=Favolaschia claudopus TaxID=2862362 RepID=A0AAW0CYM2_9AGAR